MGKVYKSERTLNGTWGELYIDDEYMADAKSVNAKVTIEKTEVNQTGTLAKGYKITGVEGKGTIVLNKTSSYFIKKISDNLKAGKTTVCTLRSKLADPDTPNMQAEDVTLKRVTFDELTLIDWEAKKLLEESTPFTFSDWDINEAIEHALVME